MVFDRMRLYGRGESLAKCEKNVGKPGYFSDTMYALRYRVALGRHGTGFLRRVLPYGSKRFVDDDGMQYRYFYDTEGLCHGDE